MSADAIAAASLDELKATDAQLTQAIAVLDDEVVQQQAAVNVASQAEDAAEQAVIAADAALAATQERIVVLQKEVEERAVEEYMRPQNDVVSSMLAADGFADASRRNELIAELSDRDNDAMEQLKAAKADLLVKRKAAEEAHRVADERRAAEQSKLDQLNKARADKAELDKALQVRIDSYAAEDDSTEGGPGTGSSQGAGDASLEWPLHGSIQINSPFGTRWGKLHKGLDLQASIGTPIYAAAAGNVTKAGTASGYGNYTCIDHGGGVTTCYGHQKSIGVSVGQHVEKDQQIGLSGNTGTSTGPHLHFETWVNGQAQDPIKRLPPKP